MGDDRIELEKARLLAGDWRDVACAGEGVLAAVSGGADSIALLRMMIDARRAAEGASATVALGAGGLTVGHVNHGLRGPGSDEDEEWLRQQCAQLGVPLLVRQGDAAEHARLEGDGVEAAARDERYRLLTEMADEAGARIVATAHTRDDQAETVLFRLLRGSGLRGLAGMHHTRDLSPSVTLVRPLLGFNRLELREYLVSLGQQWREDPTNGEHKFARNRIRGELLPYLREHFNSDVDAALVRTGDLAGEAQKLIESQARVLLEQCEVVASDDAVTLHVGPLKDQPPLLAVEALRAAWRAAGWPEQAMTHGWWRQLAAMAQGPRPQPGLNLPGNVLARRGKGKLELRRG